MEKMIKIGLGVMIKDGNRVLLGHRPFNGEDTGGIFEPDSWAFPGGKQEYGETVMEGAIREIKEETNLDISDLRVFGVQDDIQSDRHFLTVQIIAGAYSGTLQTMEPSKEDEWKWFDLDNLPVNIYSPTRKFIEKYKYERNHMEQ